MGELNGERKLFVLLVGVVVLLIAAVIGLFLRVNRLEQEVLTAVNSSLATMPFSEAGLEIGVAVPSFILPDSRGQQVSLVDLADSPVMLVFCSVHCPGCKNLYPHLAAFGASHPEIQGVLVSKGTVEENLALAQETGFSVLMWDDQVAQVYQVLGTPFVYLLGEGNRVINRGFANSLEHLEELAGFTKQ